MPRPWMSRLSMPHLSTLAVAVALAAAPAVAAETRPEDVLKMRQGLFQAVKANFGPMVAVAKGEAPFDAAAAATRAADLSALARIVPQGFAPGSETLPGAKAKPEAWTKAAEFRQGLDAFQADTARLAELAKSGNADAVKAQVMAVGKGCKSCHETFKAD